MAITVRRKLLGTVLGVTCVLLIGWVDYLPGPEPSVALFYVLPILAAAWWAGRVSGTLVAVAAGFAWLAVDALQLPRFGTWVHCVNFGVRALVFVALAYIADGAHRTWATLMDVLARRTTDLDREAVRRRTSEDTLDAVQGRLADVERLDAIGRLIGGAALGFRDDLTIIGGYCDLALGEAVPHSLRRRLVAIQQAAGRASRLTGHLLALGRREAANPCVIRPDRIVRELAADISQIGGPDVTVVFSVPDDASAIRADPDLLARAILTLVASARDGMVHGGRIVIDVAPVQVGAADGRRPTGAGPGPYVAIGIADSGPGFSEEALQHLFEPFHSASARPGRKGLVLSAVHDFVTGSSGFITVDSRPGKGARFQLHFPRVEAVPEPRPAAPPLPPEGRETLLVLEDNAALRELMVSVLEGLGYQVLTAPDASQLDALLAGRPPPDLLVSDVLMPDVAGPEVARRLRERHPGMKVLFLSGFSNDGLAERGLRVPDDELLVKPFRPVDLAQAVRRILDRAPPPA